MGENRKESLFGKGRAGTKPELKTIGWRFGRNGFGRKKNGRDRPHFSPQANPAFERLIPTKSP